MGSFGEKLKREREMRAITLEEIAEATKIGTRSLRALEEEQFDQLPGGIFNKGFVRAYAKFLGIDEEQAVADYVAATEEVGTSTATQLQALAEEAERKRAVKEAADGSDATGVMLASLIILVVLCGIGFGAYKAWSYKKTQQEIAAAAAATPRRQVPPPVALQQAQPDASQTPADTNAANTTASGTAAGAGISTTGVPNPPSSSASTPSTTTPTSTSPATAKSSTAASTEKPATLAYPIVVNIKAVKKSWIKVTADGRVIYQQQMDPASDSNRAASLHASDKMSLLVGNAAGVELTVNGKPAGALGTEGQARTINITPQGIQR